MCFSKSGLSVGHFCFVCVNDDVTSHDIFYVLPTSGRSGGYDGRSAPPYPPFPPGRPLLEYRVEIIEDVTFTSCSLYR